MIPGALITPVLPNLFSRAMILAAAIKRLNIPAGILVGRSGLEPETTWGMRAENGVVR